MGALGIALGAPLWSTALALMAFGVLHNALELRYVGGRFPTLLRGPYLVALVGLITGIVVARLIGSLGGSSSTSIEIVFSYALLAAAVVYGSRGRWRSGWPFLAVGVLAVAAAVSLEWPAHHVVVITHLHNLIPLAFLWDLSRPMARPARSAFRAAQLGWVIVVPGLILAGVFDGVIARGAGDVPGLGGSRGIAPFTSLPDTWDTTAGRRFLAVFAFLQLMHFIVWVVFIPRWTPRATARFEARVPALRGRRFWIVALAAAGAFVVLFLADYAGGRTAYTTLASYHAYLELPILIGLALVATDRAPLARRP